MLILGGVVEGKVLVRILLQFGLWPRRKEERRWLQISPLPQWLSSDANGADYLVEFRLDISNEQMIRLIQLQNILL